MFFARTVAHRMDWRQMANELEPWEVDEWMAMYRIRPWGIEPSVEEEKPASALSVMRSQAGV